MDPMRGFSGDSRSGKWVTETTKKPISTDERILATKDGDRRRKDKSKRPDNTTNSESDSESEEDGS